MSLQRDKAETIMALPLLILSRMSSLFVPLAANTSPRDFEELTVRISSPSRIKFGGRSVLLMLIASWTHFGMFSPSRLLREKDETVLFELGYIGCDELNSITLLATYIYRQ